MLTSHTTRLHILRYLQKWVLTFARIALGAVFIYHAYRKMVILNIDGTIAYFKSVPGMPFPVFSAWFAMSSELFGGLLLVIGLAVPVAAFFLIIDMLAAIYVVHLDHGFLATQNGWEYPLVLIIALTAIGVTSYGTYGLDTPLLRRALKNELVLKLNKDE